MLAQIIHDWRIKNPPKLQNPAKRGAAGLLRTLCRRLCRHFPGATLRVRVDGGFTGHDWLDMWERQQVKYGVGLASNARLVRRAGRLLGEAHGLSTLVAAPSMSTVTPCTRPGGGPIGDG